MIKCIIFSIVSFLLGIFAREVINLITFKQRKKKKIKLKKVNPLYKQNFKQAVKDLEIK